MILVSLHIQVLHFPFLRRFLPPFRRHFHAPHLAHYCLSAHPVFSITCAFTGLFITTPGRSFQDSCLCPVTETGMRLPSEDPVQQIRSFFCLFMDKAGTGICDAAYRREDTFPGMVFHMPASTPFRAAFQKGITFLQPFADQTAGEPKENLQDFLYTFVKHRRGLHKIYFNFF